MQILGQELAVFLNHELWFFLWSNLVNPNLTGLVTLVQSTNRSRAAWPCCDHTSSDDDEHNTDNSLLLLFADADIAPTLLAGLSDVDVLHIALGCRFALDIVTIAQQYRPSPDLELLPLDAELKPWLWVLDPLLRCWGHDGRKLQSM